MKGNWVLKLAGLTLALVLVTSFMVAGTYAKYVGAFEGSDTARVAKFAFNVAYGDEESEEFKLFDYANTGWATVWNDGVGADGKKLIAPGTNGSIKLSFENLSEVNVELTGFAFEETNDDHIPVYYTVGAGAQRYSSELTGNYGEGAGSGTYKPIVDLVNEENPDDLEVAIKTALTPSEETDVVFAATNGTVASAGINITLNWAWAEETAGTGQSDASDTALGEAQTAAVITVELTASVEQTDKVATVSP